MTHPIAKLIKQRYSSRAYVKAPIAPEQARSLASGAEAVRAGRLGTPLRFTLVIAAEGDSRTLRGLGTYALIKNPAGFLIGAVGAGERSLEDFGYGMEERPIFSPRSSRDQVLQRGEHGPFHRVGDTGRPRL